MVMDDFPIRDLMRRKAQTLPTIVTLAVCVAMTVFFTLFGENLGAELIFATSGRLTEGLSTVLSRFIFIVALLNSAAGVLVTSFLIAIMISERMRDIGLMKAVGCLTDMVFAHFAVELCLITLAGCFLGTISGVIANSVSVWLLDTVGFHVQPKPINPWILVLIFFLFTSLSLILGIQQIIRTIRTKPVDALSQIFPLRTTYKSGSRIPPKLGFTVKIALRALARRRSQTVQIAVCLSVILALMTLSIFGGIVAKETTQKYVERAIGKDIILIAEPEMAEHYTNLLSSFFEPRQAKSINYLEQKYMIPSSLISDLALMRGITKIDPRLILETTIYEYPRVFPDPENPNQYVTIGDHRSCRVLAIGVNPNQVVNDWLILGRKLEEMDLNKGLVGDSVGLGTFDSPLKQIFRMLDSDFSVVGVCVDPMNNGAVAYVPVSTLHSLSKTDGYNLLLLQTDLPKRLETLSRIEAEVKGTNLVMLGLNEVLSRHLTFLECAWSMALPLSVCSLLNAVFCLSGYAMLSLMSQRGDLGVMRALGAKPAVMVKIIFLEALLLVLVTGVIGAALGFTIALTFFIPEATLSETALAQILILILLVVGAISTSSTYLATKVTKEAIIKTIS